MKGGQQRAVATASKVQHGDDTEPDAEPALQRCCLSRYCAWARQEPPRRRSSRTSRQRCLGLLLLLFFLVILLYPRMRPASKGKQPGTVSLMRTLQYLAEIPGGFVLFAIGQVVAITCFCPFASVFDYSAGALWGPVYGALLVCCGKGGAALLTFFLVRTFHDGRFGAWVRRGLRSEPPPEGSHSNLAKDIAMRLQDGVAKGGLGFCIILRLSPLPSWVANYALPIAGVPFPVYASACIGMLPPLIANVYQGAATRSMVGAIAGSSAPSTHPDARSGGMMTIVLATLQYSMGLVLAHRLAVLAKAEEAGGRQCANGEA
mmetsp:Transcript_26733/g.61578  ORF Transcript_26733/g.61578 Transcript_26733/m.61578 type:complete len:318 (-) Transcript_26733:47-1000(-)